MIRKILMIAAGCVTLVAIGLVTWIGPRNLIGFVQYGGQVREGILRVGDAAPIVPLVSPDDSSSRLLSDWIGQRPLVLVFGSFT